MKALPVRSVWPAALLLVFIFFLAFFCLFLVFFGCTPSAVRALVAVDFYLITAPNFRHFKRWRHKIIASAENIKKKPARNGSWLGLGAAAGSHFAASSATFVFVFAATDVATAAAAVANCN